MEWNPRWQNCETLCAGSILILYCDNKGELVWLLKEDVDRHFRVRNPDWGDIFLNKNLIALFESEYLREEAITKQIAAVLTTHSLPDETADWMVKELKAERERNSEASQEVKQQALQEIAKLDIKIDRLTAAYLENGVFTPAEFRSRKEEMLNGKRTLMEKVAALETDDVQRFEPLSCFISRAK